MYTLVVNENNEIITTIKERIMHRSKLVDNLHFLVDPMYKGHDMSTFTVVMEYVRPVSRELRTETLVLSSELYKGQLEYTIPVDTWLTKEAGKVELHLTFAKVEMDEEGNVTQRVRKAGPASITIVPLAAWSNVVADDALTAIDQRLIMAELLINAANDMNQSLSETKADSIRYDAEQETLQLTSGGVGVGDKVSVRDMLEDGIPVVDLGATPGNGNDNGSDNDQNTDCGCDHNCQHGDDVVEFYNTAGDVATKGDVVEF